MRQLVGVVRAQPDLIGPDAELHVPAHALLEPVLVPLLRLVRRDEVLHLHLLELARAEDEVAGGDLVAERLADLRDSERRLLTRELQDVLEVEEDPLGGLGAQEDARALLRDRAHVGLEHQVEHARLGQLAAALGAAQLALGLGLAQVILAPAPLALAEALDERVGEALEVAGGLPRLRVEQDRRVQGDDVVAQLEHRAPPLVLDVVLQEDAVVPVVVGVRETAVDLGRREDEPAPLAQGDDRVHRERVLRRHRANLIRGTSGVDLRSVRFEPSSRRVAGLYVNAMTRPIRHLAAWVVWHSMRISLLDDLEAPQRPQA